MGVKHDGTHLSTPSAQEDEECRKIGRRRPTWATEQVQDWPGLQETLSQNKIGIKKKTKQTQPVNKRVCELSLD